MKIKKSNPSGGMEIALIGGAGLLVWWWLSQQTSSTTGAPVSTATQFVNVGGGTAAAPKQGDAWLNSAGAVVAVFQNGAWGMNGGAAVYPSLAAYQSALSGALLGTPGAPPAATPPTTTSTGAPIPPQNATPVQVTGGGKLGTIYQNLQNAISTGVGAGDPAISGTGPSALATPYVWNYYLALSSVNGNAFTSAPDVATVFAGQDMSKPMALSAYWAGMAPALTAKYGLSGLRGMGAIPQSPYFNRVMGGWLA